MTNSSLSNGNHFGRQAFLTRTIDHLSGRYALTLIIRASNIL